MSRLPPTSDELMVSPELAILHALAAALTAAERALLAAHPELEEEDLCPDAPPRLNGTGWIADAILTHIAGLDACVGRYFAEERRVNGCGIRPPPF